MKARMIMAAFAAAMMLLPSYGFASVKSQDGPKQPYCRIQPRNGRPDPAAVAANREKDLYGDLDLTPAQKAKIDAVNAKKAQEAQKARERAKAKADKKKAQAKAEREKAQKKRAEARTKYLAEMRKIMTPEQYAKFEAKYNALNQRNPAKVKYRREKAHKGYGLGNGRPGVKQERMKKVSTEKSEAPAPNYFPPRPGSEGSQIVCEPSCGNPCSQDCNYEVCGHPECDDYGCAPEACIAPECNTPGCSAPCNAPCNAPCDPTICPEATECAGEEAATKPFEGEGSIGAAKKGPQPKLMTEPK